MIRVTVELVSAIHPSRNRVLGVAHISNDGTGNAARASYNATFSKSAPKLKETWLEGRVEGFDRQRRGGWDLLFLALRSAVGKRNP